MKPTRGQIIASIVCLIPVLAILLAWQNDTLSANPIQDITLRTGRTAVILLLASLTCTPLKNLLGLNALLPIRKTLGLFAFLYVGLHFLVFTGLDFELNPVWIIAEIRQKPFIQIGLISFILLIPLAVTSIKTIQRKMGHWWGWLHRLVYPITALAVWHYYLASKGDILVPLIYFGIFIALLLLRIPPLSKISISNKPRWLRSINRFLLQ